MGKFENYLKLSRRYKELGFLADPMTIWIGNEACCEKANGFIIYNHDGIENVRQRVGDKLKVYAFRECDDLNCEPATIENHEVVVNFFGYFITEADLDWCFKEIDYQPVYTWDYDPW